MVALPSLHTECIWKSPRYCDGWTMPACGAASTSSTRARLRKRRRSARCRPISSARVLSATAFSAVADSPVRSTSSAMRVDDGPTAGIFSSVPSDCSSASRGRSNAITAAAAPLYPHFCCRVFWIEARSRSSAATIALISGRCGSGGGFTDGLPASSGARAMTASPPITGTPSAVRAASGRLSRPRAGRGADHFVFFTFFVGCRGGIQVQHSLADVGELLIGCLLFAQRLLEQVDDPVESEQARVSNGGAIGSDLVMLDALRHSNNRRISEAVIGELFADVLVALFDDALDSHAFVPLGRLAERFERLLEAGDLRLGLTKMLLERRRQVVCRGRVDELGDRLRQPLFGVIQVAKLLDQQA